jgi:hypothetical protein
MTPDERNLLTQFLNDLTQYQNVAKDPEAFAMIQQALSRSPDAAYVLVQHAIISDQALHAAQAHIVDLENQLAAARPQYQPQGGFLGGGLGSIFGGGQQQQTYQQPQYTQAPPPQQGGFGSFLRTAGTMAAGVAAGDLLFSGVEGLFGGHRGGGLFGGGGGNETIINEYNDYGGGMGGGMGDGMGDDWDDNSGF